MLSSSISQSLPLPLAVTFSQYGASPQYGWQNYIITRKTVELWKRLAKHYHPFRLVWYVMTGRVLDTIPRTYILNTT
jgi:phosphatidylinositol glycan class Q protein